MNKYAARLLKLAEFLEKLPRKRFNYSTWFGRDWKGKPDLSCGTTACALGWAATMPNFKRLGLEPWFDYTSRFHEFSLHGHRANYIKIGDEIFGLTEDEAGYLFAYDNEGWTPLPMSPHADAGPKQVAKHIRRFVEYKYK
jgi:hypothetical protein